MLPEPLQGEGSIFALQSAGRPKRPPRIVFRNQASRRWERVALEDPSDGEGLLKNCKVAFQKIPVGF